MWTLPRSRSTALLKSLNSNKNIDKCLFEPFLEYFMGKNKYINIINKIKNYNNKNIIIKEIVTYIPKNLDYNFFKNKMHTFLIREPEEIVRSYVYKCKQQNYTPDYSKELRFDKFYNHFIYIKNNFKQKIILIDSKDLTKNPKLLLKKYCKLINIPFDENMLNFNKLIIESSANKLWLNNCINSNKFEKTISNKKEYNDIILSNKEVEIIKHGTILYKKLLKYKINI